MFETHHGDLLRAFIRGRLPDLADANDADLIAGAREAGLSMHKFKRKNGPPRVQRVLGLLRSLAPESLLDIGCGRGAFLWPLLAEFPELQITAIDSSEIRVRDVNAVRDGGIGRLTGRLDDVTDLGLESDSFDVVTILEVLEHLETPHLAAAETLRVSRRFVVASVPSKPDDNPGHIRLFDKETLTALFLDCGASRVSTDYVRNHMIAVVRV